MPGMWDKKLVLIDMQRNVNEARTRLLLAKKEMNKLDDANESDPAFLKAQKDYFSRKQILCYAEDRLQRFRQRVRKRSPKKSLTTKKDAVRKEATSTNQDDEVASYRTSAEATPQDVHEEDDYSDGHLIIDESVTDNCHMKLESVSRWGPENV